MQTNFWKYFFNTLKTARWLIVKYLIVGIYLIAVGIIANRLQLQELTYYNAMITIIYFAEIIGYAFNEGFGIYINQNINNPEKSKQYAKMGFYFSCIFTFVLCLVLALMPELIITKVLGLTFEINYTFYYLMILATFLVAIVNYIAELLKKVELFRFQTSCVIIQCGLILLGLLTLVLNFNLLLVLIGIVYITANLICAITGFVLLLKNNIYKINLLKFEKIHIDKDEKEIILTRTFTELVWEIGYFFLSLFILRSDIVAYNQYCYFENVLDIINGFIFAVFNVTAIKICRHIGSGNKDKAYNYAVNSLKATFLMWGIYAIISFACFVPLRAGMNVDLQASALTSLILYVVVSLLRFIDWNLGSYILGQSEMYTKQSLILECISTVFWISMYILTMFVDINIYVVYIVIAFECIYKIVVQYMWFKRKKWLNKM